MILTAVFVAAGAAPAALAADVAENELDSASSNNTLASAQAIGLASFTNAADSNIFGTLPTASVRGRGGMFDVDFYRFNAPPGMAYFDIDGGTGDTYLALFDSDGTILGASDDSFPADSGSASDLDAFLGQIMIPKAGVYYIAVSAAGNTPGAAFSGADPIELFRPDGVFGGHAFTGADFGDSSYLASGTQDGDGYTLHITVPAPGSLALMGAGVLLTRRRR